MDTTPPPGHRFLFTDAFRAEVEFKYVVYVAMFAQVVFARYYTHLARYVSATWLKLRIRATTSGIYRTNTRYFERPW